MNTSFLVPFQNFLLPFILFPAVILLHLWRKSINFNAKKSKLTPPSVSGSIPFFGHALSLGRGGVDFLEQCYNNYGPIFKLKLFRFSFLVICDPSIASEFYKSSKEELSLYKFTDTIAILDTLFPDRGIDTTIIPHQIRTSLAWKQECFPRIEAEAKLFVKRIQNMIQAGLNPDLMSEANRYITRTSASVLGAVELGDEAVEDFFNLSKLISNVVLASFVLPKWLLKPFYKTRLTHLRTKIAATIIPEIQKYRSDPDKNDSTFLRTAVDLHVIKSGKPLTDKDISNFYIAFLFAAVGNTTATLNNVIIDISINQKISHQLRDELSQKHNGGLELSTIIKNKLLKCCIMETVRTSIQAFSSGRCSTQPGGTFHGYDVSGVDFVTVCPPLIQCQGPAESFFYEPQIYNPSRFLPGTRKEPQTPPYINAWGGGCHVCPGKSMAFVQIQTAITLLLQKVWIECTENTRVEINKFSPLAILERRLLGAIYSNY